MTMTGTQNIPEISIVAASSVELFICLILPCVDNLHITIGYYTVNRKSDISNIVSNIVAHCTSELAMIQRCLAAVE